MLVRPHSLNLLSTSEAIKDGHPPSLRNRPQKGGLFILEAYDHRQLGRHTGGPQTTDLPYDISELLGVFAELEVIEALTTGLCNRDGEDRHKGPVESSD